MARRIGAFLGTLALAAVAGGAVAGGAVAGAGPASGTFRTIDRPGALRTWPEGITSSGAVFGQFETAQGYMAGFVLRRGRWTTVEDPLATWSTVVGILASGAVVGDYLVDDATMHGFEDDHGRFRTINDPRATPQPTATTYGGTSVNAVDAAGVLVGSFAKGRFTRGFVERDGRFTTVDYPGVGGSIFTELTSVDAAGTEILGLSEIGRYFQAFVEHGRSFVRRNSPAQPRRVGAATFLDGVAPTSTEIAGYWTRGQFTSSAHGFVIVKGRFIPLNDPDGTYGTSPTGVNDAGVVVGYYDTAQSVRGFEFTPAA